MPVTAAVASKTIVVADDTAFVRDRFTSALQSAGHRALAAPDTEALLAIVRREAAALDLLVVDLRLPGLQGAALVRALRSVNGLTAPIVVFSGTIASADEVRELASAGVAAYVNEYSATQNIVAALSPHLFPEQSNRRACARVVVGVSIAYRVGNTIAAALTLNISRGGLAIRTTSPLEKGTVVKVRFRLPGVAQDIDADGLVAWTDRRLGMGVQFTRIGTADQDAIDEFVRTHFFSNRKA